MKPRYLAGLVACVMILYLLFLWFLAPSVSIISAAEEEWRTMKIESGENVCGLFFLGVSGDSLFNKERKCITKVSGTYEGKVFTAVDSAAIFRTSSINDGNPELQINGDIIAKAVSEEGVSRDKLVAAIIKSGVIYAKPAK